MVTLEARRLRGDLSLYILSIHEGGYKGEEAKKLNIQNCHLMKCDTPLEKSKFQNCPRIKSDTSLESWCLKLVKS